MTAATLTITDFLLARIAEDEASDMGMGHHASCRQSGGFPGMPETAMGCDCGVAARVLAECEAKRRIIAGAEAIRGRDKSYAERLKHTDSEDAVYVIAGDLLRHLAAVYADHPDYREEWRL